MVMHKRLDCERRGGEGITAGRGGDGNGGGVGRGIVVVWGVGWWDCQVGMEWRCEDVVKRNRTKDGAAAVKLRSKSSDIYS